MSNLIDDKTLADYQQRDSEFSQRYRAIESGDVPADLDRLVMQQAADSVQRALPSKLRSWQRWSAPFAAAATIVLAISIVIRNDANRSDALLLDDTQTTVSEADTGTPAQLAPESAAPAIAATRSKAEIKQPAKRERQSLEKSVLAEDKPSPPAVAAALPEAPQPEGQPTAIQVVTSARPTMDSDRAFEIRKDNADKQERELPRLASASAGSLAKVSEAPVKVSRTTAKQVRSSAPSIAEFEKQTREANPVVWLQHILELRRDGKADDADSEWQRFVKAYPNYLVEADDAARSKPDNSR